MKSLFKKVFIILAWMACLCTLQNQDASALSGNDQEIQKAYLNGLWNCYNNGSIGAPISLQDTPHYTTYLNGKSIFNAGSTSQNIMLPTYFTGIASTGVTSTPHQISCQDFFTPSL